MTCVKCGRRAAFMCPIGTMCPTDALLAAALHDWIPAQIRPEDRLERIPAEYLDAFRIGNDPAGLPRAATGLHAPGDRTSPAH
ncbi:MAG: hypothetical protein WEB67_01185 [Acidimicrobiia bacterium]